MSTAQIHVTLERLCNLLRVDTRAHVASDGLLPIQLEALHYLSLCNRYSDTVQGVTEFLGQTKGTVSQSIKVLESQGLVRKLPDADDRRLVHLKITPAGSRLLSNIVPAQFLRKSLELLPEQNRRQLARALDELLRAAQQANQRKSFAACKSCRFNESVDGSFRCGLTGEALSKSDGELICREHDYPAVV